MRFLANFALYKMRTEMTMSTFYRHHDYDKLIDEEDTHDTLNKDTTVSRTSNLKDTHEIVPIEDAKQEGRKISLAALCSRIDVDKIEKIFGISHILAPERPQYVILLKDGSFLCTCLLLQNTGVVCTSFTL